MSKNYRYLHLTLSLFCLTCCNLKLACLQVLILFFQAGAKALKKNELQSERERRARARGLAKQKESESSDESSSEGDEKSGRRSKVQKSESEADADEEASSRESSQRPNARRFEGRQRSLLLYLD